MLKKQYLMQIRSNNLLMFALLQYFDISVSTLYRWLDQNNQQFTQYGSLRLIASYLEIENVNEMLELEKLPN
jgi:hypothetical protein